MQVNQRDLICTECYLPIYPSVIRSPLGTRGVTKLECGHQFHTLCLRIIYDINSGNECPSCGFLSEAMFEKNFPKSGTLESNSAMFAMTYLKPYYRSQSNLDSSLASSPFRDVFLEPVGENSANFSDEKLAENHYAYLVKWLHNSLNNNK